MASIYKFLNKNTILSLEIKKGKIMNSNVILISVLILVKVLVISIRHANAEINTACYSANLLSYLSQNHTYQDLLYTADNNYYTHPLFRCGEISINYGKKI